MSFLDQIAKAREDVRHAKEHMPHLFPEWHALEEAKAQAEIWRQRADALQAEWDALGKEQTK